MRSIVGLGLIGIAAASFITGSAGEARADGPSSVTAKASKPEKSGSLPMFGVMLDAGVPDGATASLVMRPWRPLRLAVGGSYNLVSPGVRAGLSLIPFNSWFTPTLNLDVGHYRDGDANPIARKLSGDPTFSNAVLDRIGYTYVDAHLGFEMGRKWFTFYVHAGMSRVFTAVHELDSAAGDQSGSMTSVSFQKDPTVTVTAVSARLGFIVYVH